MATRKIEVNEDDLKKVIFILKLSKEYTNIPPQDLFLGNLWRVAPKLGDKLMRLAKLEMVKNKGRITLKPIGEVPPTAEPITNETPLAETEQNQPVEEQTESTKVFRCRKRKSKL